jgi:hypothetical protein
MPTKQVLSSVVAAWTDVSSAGKAGSPVHTADDAAMNYVNMFRNLNVGYFWMLMNCITSASYVDANLTCEEAHADGESGLAHAHTHQGNWVLGLGLHVMSRSL